MQPGQVQREQKSLPDYLIKGEKWSGDRYSVSTNQPKGKFESLNLPVQKYKPIDFWIPHSLLLPLRIGQRWRSGRGTHVQLIKLNPCYYLFTHIHPIHETSWETLRRGGMHSKNICKCAAQQDRRPQRQEVVVLGRDIDQNHNESEHAARCCTTNWAGNVPA